jgi:hypothetical protein
MKHLLTVTLIVFLFSALPVVAQETNIGLTLNLGSPQRSFSDNVERLGIGLSMNGGYRFAGTPLYLGAEIGFMNFGVDERTVPWSSTIPDLRVDVDNSYNLLQGMLVTRFQAPEGKFRPYAEGLLGFNYFFTETSVNNRGGPNSGEPIASDTNYEDTALAYGLGAGFMFQVFDSEGRVMPEGTTAPSKAYVNIGVRYMYGNEARYLTKGSITIDSNSNVIYNPSTSRTDMIMFTVGFIVRL